MKESYDSFKELLTFLFPTFEGLLFGILSNKLAEGSTFHITVDNAKTVAKGLMINRLLTTFKLKHYIFEKLKEKKLSPSISLAEYYDYSEPQIFLNFSVINVSNQRLTFLNKNSMPNMPLWAAIVASSSLPFYHKFFEANRAW